MKIFDDIFKWKSFDGGRLSAYGFSDEDGQYKYSAPIMDGEFVLRITVCDSGVDCIAVEADSGEAFTLFNVESAQGAFVGQMRAEAEVILKDICAKCFYGEIFKSRQTKAAIAYAREKYGDREEYLWEKFPDNAILRRRDTRKWYAVIMTVNRKKLGLDGEGNAEVIDLRGDPEQIESLVDGKYFLRGYHMNKQHWYTICLDGAVADEQLFEGIDKSYIMAVK